MKEAELKELMSQCEERMTQYEKDMLSDNEDAIMDYLTQEVFNLKKQEVVENMIEYFRAEELTMTEAIEVIQELTTTYGNLKEQLLNYTKI
jgi:hypothetical protein